MTYLLESVSALWPERKRIGKVIVPHDAAAQAVFARTWGTSPDISMAMLHRPDGTIIAGGFRTPVQT